MTEWEGAMTGASNSNEQLRTARVNARSPGSPGAAMSRRELAELINAWIYEHLNQVVELDANYIGKLERGLIRWPQTCYRTAMRAILDADRDSDLGFRRPRRAGHEPEGDDVERKEFLQLALTSGAAFVAAHPLAELAAAFAGPQIPTRVGTAQIEEIRAVTRLLHACDFRHGGGTVRAATGAQLRYATELLSAESSGRHRQQLLSATGNLFCTTGFMAFDAADHATASRRYSFALSCAQEAGDWHLRANALSDMARQAFWAGDESALTLIDLALVGREHLVPEIRAMLFALRARSLARRGQVQETLSAIGTADDEFARAGVEDGPLTVNYYDAAEHAAETGHALADLAEHQNRGPQAQRRLTEAIEGYGSEAARSRAFCQVRLATLLMATGDPHEAVSVMHPIVSAGEPIRSTRLTMMLNDLHATAQNHSCLPEVADLQHQALTISA